MISSPSISLSFCMMNPKYLNTKTCVADLGSMCFLLNSHYICSVLFLLKQKQRACFQELSLIFIFIFSSQLTNLRLYHPYQPCTVTPSLMCSVSSSTYRRIRTKKEFTVNPGWEPMIISFVSLLCVLMPVVTTLSIFLSLFECKQWKPLDVTQYLPKNDAKFENKHLAYKIQ